MTHAGGKTSNGVAGGGQVRAAMVMAPISPPAALLLAHATPVPAHDSWRTLLDRAGLLEGDAGPEDQTLPLTFGGTRLLLRVQPAMPDIGDDATMALHGIGGASVAAPPPTHSIALEVRAEAPDRPGRVRQVQHLCAAAAMIAKLCDADRLFWAPAGLWSPATALADAVAALEAQGLPPVLHLVAFLPEGEGQVTRGLAYFCGCELSLTSSGLRGEAVIRRLARLAVHAMLVGPLQPGAVVAGLEHGETMAVGPMRRQGDTDIIDIALRRGA